MTLENTLLARLTEWRPPPGRESLTVTDPASGWSATVSADRQDALSCLVWELAVRRGASAEGGDLRSWAERLAERTTGLVEPLKVLEVDALRNEALLRSDNPSQRGEDLFYYEVLLRGTREAVLRRFQAWHKAGDRREQVPFALTHEALARVARGLTAG
jgi:hypothetical protein